MNAKPERFGDDHLALVIDAGRFGMWSWNALTDEVTWDDAMQARFGLPPSGAVHTFDDYLERVLPEDRAPTMAAVFEARESGQDLMFEHRVVWPDGSVHWLEGRGRAVFDEEGAFVGMVGVGIDIDDRKRVEEMQREAEVFRANAELVQQLEDAQRLARIGDWRWDFATDDLILSTEMHRQLGGDAPRTGQELLDLWTARVHPEDRDVFEETQAQSITDGRPFTIEHRLVVGEQTRYMVHRGEIIRDDSGAIAGIRGTSQDVTERRETEEALLTTRDRLAQEQRAVQVLHEALIRPEFPAVAGFEIAARYLSAEIVGDVGGDWYDAFSLPDGRLMLAVGDVSGHGIRAARLMAKLRHATRAYATLDPDPAHVLTHLDEFMGHFCEPEEFATVQLATLDPDTGVIELVSAGHPLPLLVHAESAEFVGVDGTRVLGITMLPMHIEPIRLTLEPGSALLFYTDGLVERRGIALATLGDGADRLVELTLDDADAGASAGTVCDDALGTCLRGVSREDDVCVLVVLRQAQQGSD
jgi:phosphoserine phosphatase RsbU/P